MKKLVRHRFTLVEILVSMAVFSILLTLMMQFFSGARTLWTANEKRSVVYSDASVALDLMSTLLQSTYCTLDSAGNNQTLFEIEKSSGNDKIYFVSNSRMDLSGGSIRYLSFQRTEQVREQNEPNLGDNILVLKVFNDSDKDFPGYFYEFNVGKDNSSETVRGKLKTKLTVDSLPKSSTPSDVKILLRNVTGLEFTPIKEDGSEGNMSEDLTKTPLAIKIKLTLMESEARLREWAKITDSTLKSDFQKEHEYTFERTVWLGKRD